MKLWFDPNGARRYRIEKWQWGVQLVVWTALFLFWHSIFNHLWQLYVVDVSIYALFLTADGAENSAQARDQENEDENEEKDRD